MVDANKAREVFNMMLKAALQPLHRTEEINENQQGGAHHAEYWPHR